MIHPDPQGFDGKDYHFFFKQKKTVVLSTAT
jgi:hypothetical protein